MQLPYFYQKEISLNNSIVILSEEASKHCIQVLRMKTGEQLQLTDGNGNLVTASILKADKKNCEAKIEETFFAQRETKKICIGISLLKNTPRFEWFLEKAAEIGISEIIPLLCKRTERQHFRFERMTNILISAMLQSRQTWLPVLQAQITFHDAVGSSLYRTKLIAHCVQGEKKSVAEIKDTDNAQILIGPEGDFTEEEIEFALKNNFLPVTLGNTRLRTETAGIVAATLLCNLQ